MPDLTAPILYPFSDEGLLAALAALGTTANAVATNLLAMGFKGCRDSEQNCPVAHYLVASVDLVEEVSVDGARCIAYAGWNGDFTRTRANAVTTDPVAVFIYQFDSQKFPDLIAEGARP